MIALKYLYSNIDCLKQNLIDDKFSLDHRCIVEIYTSVLTMDEAVSVAIAIKSLLPNADIFGTSACCIVFNGTGYESETLIIIKKYNTSTSFVHTFQWTNKNAEELVDDVLEATKNSNAKLFNIVFAENCGLLDAFTTDFNTKNNDIKLFGGVAGNIVSQSDMGYVFTDQGIIEQGLIINAICGDNIFVHCSVNIACEAISPVYTVTKTEGNLLLEIEGSPAGDWIHKRVGIYNEDGSIQQDISTENDPFYRLQMVFEEHHHTGRFLNLNRNTGDLSGYFSPPPVGTKFRIGYTAPTKCVQRCFEICNDLATVPVEDMFFYSCVFRKNYHGNTSDWEITPFKNEHLCGAFMMGEIGYIDTENEFLNGSFVLTAVAEKERYIIPDLSVFENLHKIDDENAELLRFVMAKQTETISSENQLLMKNLLSQQHAIQEHLYIDPNTNINNLLKYRDDHKEKNFDKLCAIYIQNMDNLLDYMGHDGYYNQVRIQINLISDCIKGLTGGKTLALYMINHNTFSVVATDAITDTIFLEITKELYENFQFTKISNTAMPLTCKFITVLHQTDLIGAALSAINANINSQEQYILYDKDSPQKATSYREHKILSALSYALEHDGVVPYYQGIYDNKLGCINKYESLMRIIDEDGTVYTPYHFMDLAKKYHIYSRISERMIERVFQDFEHKKESVSINLSAYDISTKSFRTKLYARLATLKDPSIFIFEILEDEEFRDLTLLKKFITRVRTFGVKIAIDDFGSGYSNLLEIAKIAPDYIKVDGSIIKEVPYDDHHKLILDTIIYLSEKINTELIAEFVENRGIAEHIAKKNIAYSQGYYFAMPIPFHELTALNE